jgi:hypothetical protein
MLGPNMSNKDQILSDAEKLCFKCTLPPECCGDPKFDDKCIFLIAIGDNTKLLHRTHKIQHKCGFKDPSYGDS